MADITLDLDETEIKQQVRTLLNETTAAYWTDEEITNWIKEAVIDITTKTMCYEQITQITLVTNTMTYTEPTDCIKVYAAIYDIASTNLGLMKIHPREVAHRLESDNGPPNSFFHFAEKIGVYPLPSSAENGKKVDVYHSIVVSTIANLPKAYQRFCIPFVVAMAKFKERKNAEAHQFYMAYLHSLSFHRADLYERGADSLDMFKMPDTNAGGGQ